ncbi:MAG TPA: hypothetical protein VGN63_20645 [Flavisolibacter sp.]|jgi:hypothetical protein|nr:hypothetical protein [Flavisolibacter sp.]
MRHLFVVLLFCACVQSSNSQGILKKIGGNKVVSNVLEGKPAISTAFKDVDLKNTLPTSFGADKTYTPLSTLTRNSEGQYELRAGFYETTNLSYCLKAGTNGPAKGDAYGNAPIMGKMDDIVEAILLRSQDLWHGNANGTALTNKLAGMVVSQKDVQLLLWAIIAKADFDDMQGKTKAVALALLSPEQIVKLNGGAVKSAVNFASDKGWMEKPALVRTIEEAEQSLRQLYKSTTSTYEDFERLAVLAGINNEPQPVEFGTWFQHKDGYYVRYEPQGYPRTHVKIYVPEKQTVKLKLTGLIATPSDSRQRLAQTDMSVEEYNKLMRQ